MRHHRHWHRGYYGYDYNPVRKPFRGLDMTDPTFWFAVLCGIVAVLSS